MIHIGTPLIGHTMFALVRAGGARLPARGVEHEVFMDDNVTRAGNETARARARWFLLPAGFWIVIGVISIFAPGHDIRAPLAFVALSSPYLTLWYFASQGRAWAFLVGTILNALGTVISIFTGQIIGIGVSGFVSYRLWVAFLDCAALETATRAQVESAKTVIFPKRVSSLIPLGAGSTKPPVRIADQADEPAPAPWAPYRPQQSAPPAAAAPPKDPS
jgi:hypothetical protein